MYIFLILRRGIILLIELPWPEKPANTCVRHTETLDSCFDLIRSSQQCVPWSPPLDTKRETTGCRFKTLSLRRKFTWHTRESNQLVMVIARPINLNVSCKLHPHSLQRTRSPPEPRLPRGIGNTYPRNYYNFKGKDIDVYIGIELFLTIKLCTYAKRNCLQQNWSFAWKRIWHWINYRGWYAIKPKQTNKQTLLTVSKLSSFLCLSFSSNLYVMKFIAGEMLKYTNKYSTKFWFLNHFYLPFSWIYYLYIYS